MLIKLLRISFDSLIVSGGRQHPSAHFEQHLHIVFAAKVRMVGFDTEDVDGPEAPRPTCLPSFKVKPHVSDAHNSKLFPFPSVRH
jgi:hypothetical protein